MRASLRLLLTLLGMSILLFVGVVVYQVYQFNHDYKRNFIADKQVFGEQVARISLASMQTSNYFELYRLCNEIFNQDAMFYLMVLDTDRKVIYVKTNEDTDKIQSARNGIQSDAGHSDAVLVGQKTAVIRSMVMDDTGKSWGRVEIAYYWAPAYRFLRRQILTFAAFFLVFVSVWGALFVLRVQDILAPLNRFVSSLEELQSEWPVSIEHFNARLVPEKTNSEVTVLLNVLRASLLKLLEYEEAKRKEARIAALGEMASQVAHDIRSPLSALDTVIRDASRFPEEKRAIIRSAVGRIRDIANSLIEKNREASLSVYGAEPATRGTLAEPCLAQLLSSLVDSLISEKRLQFRSQLDVEIDSRLDPSSYGLFAAIPPSEFKRVLSNLINNAVESLPEKGLVTVRLASNGDNAEIRVQDNGKGIPPDVLTRLGQRGETHGKPGGSGLGLYHAKSSVESWGGSLTIDSKPGEGTAVTIRLPRVRPPEWFVSRLAISPGTSIVVLDDDASIHQVWKGRFESVHAEDHDIEILHFSTPSELRSWTQTDARTAKDPLYLLDYELVGYSETGLSLAEELGIGARTILVTSRSEEKGILDDSLRIKARLIPKSLAGFVPICVEKEGTREFFDAILIDDAPLARMNWKMAASESGKKFQSFSTVAEFLAEAPAIGRETPIYIDAELANNVNGAQESLRIHELGFQEIYLATGHEAARFAAYKHLRGVVGKDPPWS